MNVHEIIEEILEEKVRGFLHADGFDLQLIEVEEESITLNLVSMQDDTCKDCLLPPEMLSELLQAEMKERDLTSISEVKINDKT